MAKQIIYLFPLIALFIPHHSIAKERDLQISTWECNESIVREALSHAFWDIVESPTIHNEVGVIEIAIRANGFISEEECYALILLNHQGHQLSIRAIPYRLVNGEKRPMTEYSVSQGIYLIIQGVGMSLDYPYEIKRSTPNAFTAAYR